ncbi:MAG TPA: TetR/AcrR family transcriptional regulator [Acidimicrobiales bacterium]|jgi:AcrR family transcriptional regulator|nr:TetR/AcrR family transcriptional regulator [Acidimicrobiales bacterium]
MDSEARWEEIIEVASTTFLKNGYEGTSLQEIASEVGILKGSIYYYIKTKEDLLFEIVNRAQNVYMATLEEDEEMASAPAPVRLTGFIKRWISLTLKEQRGYRVAERSFTRLSPKRLKEVIERRDTFSDFVKNILVQGVKEGAFDPTVDVSLATITVFELLNSTQEWHQPKGRLSKDNVAEWYAQFIVRGLGGPHFADAATD